jgi:hypothetical protein
VSAGPVAGGGSLGRLARAVVAPLLSGFVGAVVFLVMIQGSFHRGHTDLDFNHVLGTLIEGDAQEVGSTDEALGVIGDTVGPTGLWSTIVGGVLLMVIHELVIVRLVRRSWLAQAVPLAVLTMLAVGVLFCGVASARFDTPIGLFGADAGGMTPLVIVLSSIGFAVVGARVHDLARNAAWWEERPDPMAERLEEVAGIEPAD